MRLPNEDSEFPMPEFLATKSLSGHIVPDEDGQTCLKKIKQGKLFKVTITQSRNLKFHRKFFKLLHVAFENQEKYDDFEAFRYEVTLRSGYWREHIHVTGSISYIPKSISFSSMDELQFSELYQKAITVIIKHFMPETTPEALERAVDEVLGFA